MKLEDGSKVVAYRLVLDTLAGIDHRTFWTFCALSAGVKFVGILASMYRWTMLLRGQGIELPFRHIFGSFLIGRFIGTFLPSTAGLDGYKLYDAARFSGKTVEVTATTALEKVLGFTGIFLSFLVSLPFGIKIFGEQAGLVAAITVPFCVGLIVALLLLLWFPGVIQWLLRRDSVPGQGAPQRPRDAHLARGLGLPRQEVARDAGARALLREPLHDGGHVLLHRARDRRFQRPLLAGGLRLFDPDPRDRALAVHDRGRGHPRGGAVSAAAQSDRARQCDRFGERSASGRPRG